MSTKNVTEVIIDGKIYTLSGYESEEYLQKIATYINNKINEYKGNESYSRLSHDMQRTLVELNIADDYFKAKKQADSIEKDLESKDKQLYDIKHDLISAQIKIEAQEKEIANLTQTINENNLKLVKLETELAEATAPKKRGRATTSSSVSE